MRRGAVLVVDGDDIQRRDLVAQFVLLGWRSDGAITASSGLELLAARTFDIAVIEVRLDFSPTRAPGLEILDWLRDHRPNILPVAVSSQASLGEFLDAKDRGAVVCRTKPTTAAEILADLSEAKRRGRKRSLQSVQTLTTHRMIAFCDGNKTEAAVALGMSRRWINDSIK